MQCIENIFKFGVEWRGGRKMGVFLPKTGCGSETIRERDYVVADD